MPLRYLRKKAYAITPKANADAAKLTPAPIYSSLKAAFTARTRPSDPVTIEPQATTRLGIDSQKDRLDSLVSI